MCEMPVVYHHSTPVARKEHRCCDCGGLIEVGEKYHAHNGVWDGRGRTHKICRDCQLLMMEEEHPSEVPLGGLSEYLLDDGNPRKITRYISNRHRRTGVLPYWMLTTLEYICRRPAIKCAAIRYKGSHYEGWSHAVIGHLMVKSGICPAPFPAGKAQGFATTQGVFVERDEALRIALACGQVLPGKHERPSALYSEDLRYDKK